MITRATGYAGESEVTLLNTDVGVLFDELNKGLDPSQLPQGKVTLDKLRLTNPGTGSNAFSMDQTPVQVPAGAQRSLSIDVASPIANVGLASTQYFPASVYADFFVDPTGAGPAFFTNIYAANTPGMGTAKIMTSAYLANHSNTLNPQSLFVVTVQVYNFDSVAHWVYVSMNVAVINTQSSTAS